MEMKTSICVVSSTGARETNQDRVCAFETTVFGKPALLLALADGMGGMQAGDRAAEIAIQTAGRYAREVLPRQAGGQADLRESIASLYREANRQISEFGRAQETGASMGTTLVLCLAFDSRYLVANAGDSRCYYVNDWEARLLTEDHSAVQDMVRRGNMTAEAAERSPFRNQLTNALGDRDEVNVDIFPRGGRWGIIDEDCVLFLCSDGLSGSVRPEDMYAHLHGARGLQNACNNLLSLAFLNGSTDNITMAAAQFGSLARRRRIGVLPPIEALQAGASLPASNRREFFRRMALALISLALVALVLLGFGIWRKDRPVKSKKKAFGPQGRK